MLGSMLNSWPRRVVGALTLGACFALAGAPPAPAVPGQPSQLDLVFLKDGFVLQGEVKRDSRIEFDGTEVVRVARGFFMVDDIARRTIFSPGQVEKTLQIPANPEGELTTDRRIFYPPQTKPLPPLQAGIEAADWDDKWDRTSTAHTIAGPISLPQHLTALTPQYLRIASTTRPTGRNYIWGGYYLTRELSADALRGLLALHPSLKEMPGKTEEENAARRFRMFYFLLQAGWHKTAEKELDAIREKSPGQKEKIDLARENLRKSRAQRLLDDIKTAQAAGRHEWAQKQLAGFASEGIDDKVLDPVRALKEKYETAAQGMKLVRQLLKDLPPKVTDPAQRRFFTGAAEAIGAELTLDHFLKKETDTEPGRLDTFLSLAQHTAEKDRKPSQADQGPAQLLALAVSGWVLGNNSAEPKADTAQRLWNARQFVLTYQKTHDRDKRRELLKDYESKRTDAVAVDEMDQLIRLLPPPEPEEETRTATVELQAELPGRNKGPSYLLRLPPEYHPGRTYPVLFVLHEAGQKPSDMLDRWSDLAGQQGYVLVAPEWDLAKDGAYHYSVKEQAAVLDVLRDLRRRFAVDSDRVFVAGCGEGGNMAYDVALSHPDLFAGILPMAAQPGPFAPYAYWRNAQYLPFYVVAGSWSPEQYGKANRAVFEQWVPRGYPAMYVEYRGRGLEWFGGELPALFDWMNRKKRANPLTEVGRGDPNARILSQSFHTMRSTDNRFYWLGTDAIDNRNLNEGARWDPKVLAATLQARINTGNQMNVNVYGVRQLTIWFGRGMIDFDKPLTIVLNLQVRWTNKKVTPKLETLLEDLYERGDRQRLYWARVDFDRL